MKVRVKLFMLVLAVAGIFAVAVLSYGIIEKYRAISLLDDEKAEKNRTFDEILKLEQSTLRLYAFDYTYWDDMVSFIERRSAEDLKWAKENIDASLNTYRADASWVLDPGAKVIYSVHDPEKPGLIKEFSIPVNAVKSLLNPNEHFCHFFIRTVEGVLEVRGATVHPGWDVKRESPVKGYFFVARLLDPAYISQLSEYLGGASVEIVGSPSDPGYITEDVKAGMVRFTRELNSWDGSAAGYFKVVTTSSAFQNYSKFSRHMYISLFFFAVVTSGMVLFFLTLWIDRPVRRISKSLEKDNSDDIRPLLGKSDEFGRMAQLIDNFFRQRNSLVLEIDRRKKIEEELSAKLSQLKQFKDIAVGREIKMIDLKKEVNKLSRELGRPEPYDASF